MTFKLRIKSETGSEWVEEFTREIGQSNKVRGYPPQPEFTGDPAAWGKALIDWFNESNEPESPKREFVEVVS